MDSRRSIKRLLKGSKGPTYHQRVSHVRNKSSYGGSGAAGGLLGAGAGEGGDGAAGGIHGDDFTKETVRWLRICVCVCAGRGGAVCFRSWVCDGSIPL